MRIALVTLLCTLVLSAYGESGVRTDDKADVEKEHVRLADFGRPQAREEVNQSGKRKEDELLCWHTSGK
jgi:hypothetical protein